ncbi:MAG: hypothetical protein DRO73_07895 [Candidatus Thorarchaeota archaeon]|nr:MAG: hypothetical protein DRO73_07895 [Candidatus Thorarchaeota archaeon]
MIFLAAFTSAWNSLPWWKQWLFNHLLPPTLFELHIFQYEDYGAVLLNPSSEWSLHTPGRRAADTVNMTVRGGGGDISELVEEVCMMIEYWRTLVMSCHGVHWSSVSKIV